MSTDPYLPIGGLCQRPMRVRHVAAVQLARPYPGEVPETTAREMLDTLLGGPDRRRGESPISREYAEATASEADCHDLGQDLALALACLPAGSADFALRPLV